MPALRNTVYEVNGKSVKLNVLLAATDADAEQIMVAMREVKPEEWFVSRGLIVYELVGSDDVVQDMQRGRALLVASD